MIYKYRVRQLKLNGDISLSGKAWLYDIDAVRQTINTRLKLFAGEYWRNVSDGTPWIDKILVKNNQANTIQAKIAILKSRILDTTGVISILKWESNFILRDRNLTVTASILTEFGVVLLDDII